MQIDSIVNGIVIDHIQAGKSMEMYNYLQLNNLPNTIAIIKNVKSKRMGKKDMIKIDGSFEKSLDLLGFFDENVTINIIRDGVTVEKHHPGLPDKVEGVIACKNPRCITISETELPQIFHLTDRVKRVFRCAYCEQAHK